jgi:hypothetical protein
MPLPSGASSPVLSEVTGGSYVYTFAVGPPLTMTWLTGMFEVQVNSVGSPSSLTSVTVIVTDRVPSSNVLDSPTPRSSKSSAWIVNVVVPATQLGLPSSSSTVRTAWAGPELTTATRDAAPTSSKSAEAPATSPMPPLVKRRRKRCMTTLPCRGAAASSDRAVDWGETLSAPRASCTDQPSRGRMPSRWSRSVRRFIP